MEDTARTKPKPIPFKNLEVKISLKESVANCLTSFYFYNN